MVKSRARAKTNWWVALSKQTGKKRSKVICCGKMNFFRDLQKLVKHVGRNKNIRFTPSQKKLFKKHRNVLKKLCDCRGPKKIQTFLLKRMRGGGFPLIPIIASVIPSLVELAVTELPKLFK